MARKAADPHRSRLAALCSVAALCVLAACEGRSGDSSPAAFRVRRMLDAERNLAYEGTKEIEYFGARPRFQWQFVDHDPARATFVENMGEPAGRNRRWRERSGRFSWLRDVDLLLRNYEVVERGRETVVGRPATLLEIRARRPARPGVLLAVDDETGLLVGSEFRDHRGNPTFRSRFRTLLLGDALPGVPPEDGAGAEPPARPPEPAVALAYRPRHLPEGFEEVRTYRAGQGLQTIYSDGLSWMTLTQRPAKEGAEERVVRQKVESVRVEMRLVLDRIEIELLGWIPAEELLPVLESLERVPGQRFSTDPDGGRDYNQDEAAAARSVLYPPGEVGPDHRLLKMLSVRDLREG